jgi:hypothetical protein
MLSPYSLLRGQIGKLVEALLRTLWARTVYSMEKCHGQCQLIGCLPQSRGVLVSQ